MADPAAAPAQLRFRRWAVGPAAVLMALLAAGLTLGSSGATDVLSLPGIPAPGRVTTWLVPGLRLLSDLAAVATVGALLGAVYLVPGQQTISPASYRWVRLSGGTAAVWMLAALASLPVQLADFLGTGLASVSLPSVVSFSAEVAQGRAQLLVAAGAFLIALFAWTVLRPAGARVLLALSLLTTLPPAFTGHAAEERSHELAVAAVAVHVLGVALWAGGLLALVLARNLDAADRRAAVQRFSVLAAPLALLVAGSGVLTAYTRLSGPSQVFETAYGRVLLVKLAALMVAVGIGWWHRRRTLPELAADRPRAFLRLAVVEVLVFAATVGVAVGLSRTPTPPPDVPEAAAVLQPGS
jgi:putative copper resistance protein D